MAKRGRRKRTKPDVTKSASGPGRPLEDKSSIVIQNDAKRQRLVHHNENSRETGSEDENNLEMRVDVEMENGARDSQELLQQPITDLTISNNSKTGGNSSALVESERPHLAVEENGFSVKSEPYEPMYEMGDVLMNGSADSIMDMPLFHEVDSLMNIKHEDHLNDTVFYLPMTYPMDNGVKIEVDNAQVAEVTRTLANELATPPGALVYVSPDQSKTVVTQHLVKQESSEQQGSGNRVLTTGSIMKGGGYENGLAHYHVDRVSYNIHDSCQTLSIKQENGNPFSLSGRAASTAKPARKGGKKGQDSCHNSSKAKVSKKKGGGGGGGGAAAGSGGVAATLNVCANASKELNRQNSQSSNFSLSDCSDGESSPASNDSTELGTVQHMVADDPPEIDRFVICSDHTMECVLCAFTTDSYSAFKSHIICSHPCWRITKKLSKNRLLVERSVKASTSVFSHSDQVELRTTKSGSATTTLHAKVDPELQKVLRKYEKNPRKRQLFERNKRLFKCTICLRLFVFEGSVVNHVSDQHGVARPYEQIHISNDHGQKFGPIYRCSQKNCYFSCESDNELERHILERHTQVMYRCQLCGFTEDSAEAVRNHGLCMHQQQLTCSDTSL